MLINELSNLTGVSKHTIRFYEKCGLIKGKRKLEVKSNNYYHYDDEAVERLDLIRDAKSVGFTLHEIGNLIEAWYSKKLSENKKFTILDEKITSIDNKIKELKEMKKMLAQCKKEISAGIY